MIYRMKVIGNIEGYPTSIDYVELWELAQKASVICIVDGMGSAPPRELSHTVTIEDDGITHLGICGPGRRSYLSARGVAEFVAACKQYHVEYIVPHTRCPHCDSLFWEALDICDECGEEFGNCDGSCGDPGCDNNHCQHCSSVSCGQCCPECRAPLPTDLWQ
jgi:hypothetical protein